MAETRHATYPVSGQRVEIRNDLTRRLRGQYANGPTMANGEPEFGWRQFGEGIPIQVEAAAEIERLRAALEELTSACELEFTGENTADDPDDEPVGGGLDQDGKPDWMLITFGMIRRARAALTPQ